MLINLFIQKLFTICVVFVCLTKPAVFLLLCDVSRKVPKGSYKVLHRLRINA